MAVSEESTLLIMFSGRDRPGVTAAVFDALTGADVAVSDVEQFVVRDRLFLSALLTLDPDDEDSITTALTHTAGSMGLQFEYEVDPASLELRRWDRLHVTVLAAELAPEAIASVSEVIASKGGHINRIRRIATYPVTAIELECSGAHPTTLQAALASKAAQIGIDVAVRKAGLDRRGQHLVVMDVDSTLIKDEVIDVLAAHAGAGETVAAITERAMAGELDFSASLRERVAALAGLDATAIDEVRSQLTLTPGARTLIRTLKQLGYIVALVSGGFTEVITPIAEELGVDHVRANALEIVDGKLTGNVLGPIVDRAGKREALEEFASIHGVPLERTIAVGDGANDKDMIAAAGLGVAFNAKPALQEVADTTINVPYLDSLLFILGITREEIEADQAQR